MTAPALDDRRKDVLRSLIDLHIETGEPVGSESLARALHRTVSPATIRSIMADLEALGYLNHPHTSAGRLPTDDGYRLYVDSLMGGPRPLAPGAAASIASELRDVSPQQVLENASHLLSRLSGNVGLVLAPDFGKATFRHLDLVRLSPPRILVVMVSQTGIVTNKVIEVEELLTQDALQACANYLNTHFAGLSLTAIRGRLLEIMGQQRALYDSLLQSVIALGERAFAASPEQKDVYLDGTANILDSAVFEDLDRMKALFQTFEEKSRLVRILNACIAGDGIRIVIGRENPDPGLRDTALVTASYPLEGESGWGLGVLGSTRMEYATVVSLVDHVARAVSKALAEMGS
jgi:heat-inducible transcriptional repressor